MFIFQSFFFVLIHYKIYDTAKAIPKHWDALTEHDVFLQTPYLNAIENAAPENITVYYIGVFKNNALVGLAMVQRVQLYLKDMFRNTNVSCFKTFTKSLVSKVLKGNILVTGNLTHTGQHGMHVDTKQLTLTEFYTEIFKALTALKQQIKANTNKTIRILLFKDFFLDDAVLCKEVLESKALHSVSVQPNMVMDLKPHWKSTPDYVGDMTKKYRTRFKRAKKKLNGVTCVEMGLEAIKTSCKQLNELYLQVSSNASFNTFILPENHFLVYKTYLKDNFKVFGYYLNEELIGFFTLICNNEKLETYFLGYDAKHQQAKQLYLNMLYDMVSFGITQRFTSVIYARTAMEIKSSVGAKPKNMVLYLKHTNGILNKILKYVFKFMSPKQNWKERHPFG